MKVPHAPSSSHAGCEDAGGFLRRRGSGVRCLRRRRLGGVEGIRGDPTPADGACHCPAQDPVDLADGTGAHGAAAVGMAPVVAFVGSRRSVVGQAIAAAAAHPALAELRVEAVEDLAVELPDLELSKGWPDVVLDVALVCAARRLLDVEHVEVPVHELVDRRLRSGVPSLVELGEELGADPLRLGRCRCELDEVVSLARQRILAGVDTHAVHAARQFVDAAASPPWAGRSLRHDIQGSDRLRHVSCHAMID